MCPSSSATHLCGVLRIQQQIPPLLQQPLRCRAVAGGKHACTCGPASSIAGQVGHRCCRPKALATLARHCRFPNRQTKLVHRLLRCRPAIRVPTCVEGAAPAVARYVPAARLVVPRLPRLLHRHRQAIGGDEEVGRGKVGQVIGRISQPAGVWRGAVSAGGKQQLVEAKREEKVGWLDGPCTQLVSGMGKEGRREGQAFGGRFKPADQAPALHAAPACFRHRRTHAWHRRMPMHAPWGLHLSLTPSPSSRAALLGWSAPAGPASGREGNVESAGCGAGRLWSRQAVESAGCGERERAGEGNAGMPLHVAVRKATLGSFGFGR